MKGYNPNNIKRAAKVAAKNEAQKLVDSEKASKQDTLENVMLQWLELDQAKNRSIKAVKRALETNILPRWGKRLISEITRKDCSALIQELAKKNVVGTRRKFAYLHRLFAWSVGQGVLNANPMENMDKPGSEPPSRDRYLSDSEIVEFWKAAEKMDYPFGPILHLLLLTGARKNEIGALTWDEIKDGAIHLVGLRTKNGKPHTIPLSPMVEKLISKLPHIKPVQGAKSYVFTTNGRSSVSGWTVVKRRLDRFIDNERKKIGVAEGMPSFRVHDLRRTVANGMLKLGCQQQAVETCLGHVGSRSGIVGVYQTYNFEAESRVALEKWAAHITHLLDGGKAKVVDMRNQKVG
jgi:integrase